MSNIQPDLSLVVELVRPAPCCAFQFELWVVVASSVQSALSVCRYAGTGVLRD